MSFSNLRSRILRHDSEVIDLQLLEVIVEFFEIDRKILQVSGISNSEMSNTISTNVRSMKPPKIAPASDWYIEQQHTRASRAVYPHRRQAGTKSQINSVHQIGYESHWHLV